MDIDENNEKNQSWKKIFDEYNSSCKEEKSLNNILNTIDSLKKEYADSSLNIDIFPKEQDIFRCFNYFNIEETKVVILGQDPYHGINQATGLCFGINKTKDARIPPSLKNIIKELKSDLNIDLTDYSLEKWAEQGVLMLNASLSVIQGKPASQMGLWSDFTDFIIERLNDCEHRIVFVAWGAFAHNKFKNIDLLKHHLIVSSHPSPLSVYKQYKTFPAFNGSKPFSKINEQLEKKIEW